MPDFKRVGQSMTSPTSNSRRMEVRVPPYVDEKGYIQNGGLIFKPVPALHEGPITGPHAVVLHRPVTRSANGTLASFARGIGTHFVVDLDGTIYQAASLKSYTSHVGPILPRCLAEGSCSPEETKLLAKLGPMPGHRHEKLKDYPLRYPMNSDSVGIEVVGTYSYDAKQWDAATDAQKKAVSSLIGILKREYSLTDADVYEHDKISRKTPGEGAGIYDGDSRLPGRFPPLFI